MTKTERFKMIEVKGKLLKKLFEGLGELEGLDLPEELMEALKEHGKVTREEVVGTLSDDLIDKFVQNVAQKEEDNIRLQRESEDWHREFDLRTDALRRAADKRHDELWALAYAEMGIIDHEKRRFSINRKAGTISEVFFDEEENDVFDFRPKKPPTTH